MTSTSSSSSPSAPRPKCVVNESTVRWQTLADREEIYGGPLRDAASVADVYRYRRRQLHAPTGGKDLTCALLEVEPGGSTAFPYHAHSILEEAIYVLAGEGVMRMPGGDFKVTAGDYVALLPGEKAAHQLWNFHAEQTLRYLCFSTSGPNDAVVSSPRPHSPDVPSSHPTDTLCTPPSAGRGRLSARRCTPTATRCW